MTAREYVTASGRRTPSAKTAAIIDWVESEQGPETVPEAVEVSSSLSAAEARRLTDEAKVAVDRSWELIEHLWTTRAHIALGYTGPGGWGDYWAKEFGTSRFSVPKEERLAVVSSLREVGMSTRAIAAATGISKTTVGRALSSGHPPQLAGVPFGTPAIKARSKFRATVTGIDGKPYPAESTRGKARPPLENQLQSAVRQLAPGVRRLAELRTDDRLADERKAIAARSLPEMRGAAEVLNEYVAYLSDE